MKELVRVINNLGYLMIFGLFCGYWSTALMGLALVIWTKHRGRILIKLNYNNHE